jgi:hypothetical protein
LAYKDSRRTDRFGNQFRYKGATNPNSKDGTSKDGRWSYAVFLTMTGQPSDATSANAIQQLPLFQATCERGRGALDWSLNLERLDFSPFWSETNRGGGDR